MDAGSIPADSTHGSQLWRVVPAKRDSLATADLIESPTPSPRSLYRRPRRSRTGPVGRVRGSGRPVSMVHSSSGI